MKNLGGGVQKNLYPSPDASFALHEFSMTRAFAVPSLFGKEGVREI